MYELKPMTPRVQKMRERYRNTVPKVCTARYRLITEFYQKNQHLIGILKRAKCFHYICENIPTNINEDEIIVGEQGSSYRASALYPESGFDWIRSEIDTLGTRDIDPYILSPEDREYILDTCDFWNTESQGAKCTPYEPDFLYEYSGNGVCMFRAGGGHTAPVGHFTANHNKAIRKGLGAIKAEADEKVKSLEMQGIPGDTINQYNFYRAVSIVCDGMILLTKRYAKRARELYDACTQPERKAELAMMVDTLERVVEKPCESFLDAVQCLFMYQTCLALDGQLHGLSFGRVDQYLGDFYEKDVAAGKLTPELGQEILDLFYLKVAEMNKVTPYMAAASGPGYTSGQLITMGGVDKDGKDATNPVTYMMLQASGRLVLHSPPQALRIHKDTPRDLWEAAICTTRIAGGVPSLENDEVIIPALMRRGLPLESARNYCLIGCVEPSGCGDEWSACGGSGGASYFNLVNALSLALHDGHNIMPGMNGKVIERRLGAPTGYLKDMTSMEQVVDAFRQQVELFATVHVACTNAHEYMSREVLPLPVASCTIDGCMEKGMDVMFGGAKYNSTGIAGVGIGNVADSLQMIDHLVFDKKICTAAELQDALDNNWEGHQELYKYINTNAPHYGNGNAQADKYMPIATEIFASAISKHTGPRGNHYAPGMYPVTANVMFGKRTPATADGRVLGQPLADGISPRQGMDISGPTALIRSLLCFNNQDLYSNGTLCNMKFDPNTVKTEQDIQKLIMLLSTYFANGGMELQINIVDSSTMRAAHDNPQEYRDLVVRVAGFSAYFVELAEEGQKDLISRTELNL